MNANQASAYVLGVEDIMWTKRLKGEMIIRGRSKSLGYFKIFVEIDPLRDDGWCAK